jgi:DUF438 domain-containing protein
MDKKSILKDIIQALHRGLSPEAAAERVLKEAGFITTAEIAGLEQSLLDEGMDPAEIQRLCNVHSLIFDKALQPDHAASTPVIDLFRAENRRIEVLAETLGKQAAADDWPAAEKTLDAFDTVIRHYVKKEQVLFPLLEKRGFPGPSQVMWGKHDEVRRLLKEARQSLPLSTSEQTVTGIRSRLIDPLTSEVRGMIDKEEKILFPTALERFTQADMETARQAFIDLERDLVNKELPRAGAPASPAPPSTQPSSDEAGIIFPSGRLTPDALTRILNVLPVDVSFVDARDEVAFFSETADRVFPRPRTVIGRNVRNCHPPKSLHAVEKILQAFKEGRKDSVDFWIALGGKTVYIRYIAVRDDRGTYLGTLEVTQDITALRTLKGEKRLLDEQDVE